MRRLQNLSDFTCGPGLTIRETLKRINDIAGISSAKFQVIVDDGGRFLGTVTDGDVRRAILNGFGPEDEVRCCMETKATIGRLGHEAMNQMYMDVHRSIAFFLPVVDDAGIVREIWVNATPLTQISALVMAGGFGTRLGERTRHIPKPLLPIGNQPILGHILDRLEAARIPRIYVSVHHMADQIVEYIDQRENKSRVEILHERVPLGTAGAIDRVPNKNELLLVVNGDILTQLDFGAFATFHNSHSRSCTVAVASHEYEIPFGVIHQDGEGTLLEIHEKPRVRNFVLAGIYLLSPEFRALAPRGERLEMPELLNMGRQVGLRVGLFPIHEYWTDIGDPHRFLEAEDWHQGDKQDPQDGQR